MTGGCKQISSISDTNAAVSKCTVCYHVVAYYIARDNFNTYYIGEGMFYHPKDPAGYGPCSDPGYRSGPPPGAPLPL